MLVSYAQNFEDVMLWRAIKHVKDGFYIDIGAQDPVIDSVSLSFYEHGWRGVHIEPVPSYAEKLRKARPDETVIQAAVGTGSGARGFFEIVDTGLSTGDAQIAERHAKDGFVVRETVVPCISLGDILDRYQDREIHWLKIDVEGMEVEVFQSWQPSSVRPWIVVVESTLPNSQIETFKDWEPLLHSLGYEFVYFDGLNRFYVSRNHQKLKVYFNSPPNIFDGAVLSGTSSGPFCSLLNNKLGQVERELHAQLEIGRQETQSLKEVLAEGEREKAQMLASQEQRERELHAQVENGRQEIRLLNEALVKGEQEKVQLLAEQVRVERELHAQVESGRQETQRLKEVLAEGEREKTRLLVSQEQRERDLYAQIESGRQEVQRLNGALVEWEREMSSARLKIDELNGHAHHWWMVADNLNKDLQTVYASRSWRITSPLRFIMRSTKWFLNGACAWITLKPGSRPRRIARWVVEKMTGFGLRARVKIVLKRILRRSIAAISARPDLKQCMISWSYRLGLYPALRRLYHRIVSQSMTTPAKELTCHAPGGIATGDDLSPWTRHMASRLKAARIGMKPGVQ